jgi:hypothetical protein
VPTPQLISTLAELPKLSTLGVIISIDTRIFTTLAVASAARHLPIPLLIVDGHSNDGSFEILRDLDVPGERWLIRMERRVHGVFIDKLLRELSAERVLLIDSDIEVKTPAAFDAMMIDLSANRANDNTIYAAGCSHGDHDMEKDGMPHAWFCRRPWIPFVLLDRVRCAELVSRATTFEVKFLGNELPLQGLANLLAKRAHFAVSKRWPFEFLTPLRKTRHGSRAAFYVYDTGGMVYEAAASRQWHLAEIGWETMNRSVVHYEGATRSSEVRRWTGASEVEQRLLATLRNDYRIELSL